MRSATGAVRLATPLGSVQNGWGDGGRTTPFDDELRSFEVPVLFVLRRAHPGVVRVRPMA